MADTTSVIAQYYADNPWELITTDQRPWYDPLLRSMYRKLAVFSQFTTFKRNLGAVNAQDMIVTELIDTHPNFTPMSDRQIWNTSSRIDSRNVHIGFKHYGGKVSMHEFDEIISYWKTNERGGVKAIINGVLGRHMVDVLDLLSRNAILNAPFKMYQNDRSNFAGLTSGDVMTPALLDQVHLGMQYRDVPYAQSPVGDIKTIVAVISPGVFYNLQRASDSKDWLNIMQYADPTRLLRYELGMFRSVRFVVTPKATLYNAGTITTQALIKSPVTAGDGAPDPSSDKVDATYGVGQPGSTHHVHVDTVTDFAVNDIVSIHKTRTSANGVSNGVDYNDGALENRRIVAIDVGGTNLQFDLPILEDFTTDLGGTVYGYITKATHIHASMFIGGPDGIVQGVARAPRLHFPKPIDDYEAMYRASWDSRMGFSVYNPAVLETVYTTGEFRMVGNALAG